MRVRGLWWVALLTPASCAPSNGGDAGPLDASRDTAAVDAACLDGQTRCGRLCVDLQSNADYCGDCVTACSWGCRAGRCEGRPEDAGAGGCLGQWCGFQCRNLQTDPQHCGQCSEVCPAGVPCTMGRCVDATGQQYCNGSAVDLQTNASNCGACGTRCPTGYTCQAGRCVDSCGNLCQMRGYQCCGGTCRDLRFDEENCGACGRRCTSTQTCTSYACR